MIYKQYETKRNKPVDKTFFKMLTRNYVKRWFEKNSNILLLLQLLIYLSCIGFLVVYPVGSPVFSNKTKQQLS